LSYDVIAVLFSGALFDMKNSTHQGGSGSGLAPVSRSPHHSIHKVSQTIVHCPMPGNPVWNHHPMVYLQLDEKGMATCPYCGSGFQKK